MNKMKNRLAAGETCIGAWSSVPSMAVAEAMMTCGFDWLAVDFEHGTASIEQAHDIFITAERHGVTAMARISNADPILARRLLDAGAAGLIVPVVEDAAAFAAFVSHCYFPPHGRRGVGLPRAAGWGDKLDIYLNEFKPIIVPQIETLAGVQAAEALAKLPEVDALFLGPYDLSASMGKAGDFSNPQFSDAVSQVMTVCAQNGKAAGIHQVKPDMVELKMQLEKGFRFVAYGTDLMAMRHALMDVRSAKDAGGLA